MNTTASAKDRHDGSVRLVGPSAEVTPDEQNRTERDAQPVGVLKNRRHNPAWMRASEVVAKRLRGVLEPAHGSIAEWARRLHVDRSLPARWTGLDGGSPEIVDAMLLPGDLAIALFRSLIRELTPPVAAPDLLAEIHALVLLAATALGEAESILSDRRIDASELPRIYAIAERLEGAAERLRAVKVGGVR